MNIKIKGGNIGKIKYFLPGRKSSQEKQNDNYKSQIACKNQGTTLDENNPGKKLRIPFENIPKSILERKINERRGPKHKQSVDQSRQKILTEKSITTDKKHMESIDIDIVGIKDATEGDEQLFQQKKNVFDMFPQKEQKQRFFQFLQGLKDDVNYQNTITMFTILYYSQKKANNNK